MGQFLLWIGQPTTIAGIATLFGTASAVLSQHLSWQAAVPLFVGAATGMLLPDNTRPPSAAPATSPPAPPVVQ